MKRTFILGSIVIIGIYCWFISYGTMALNHGEVRGSAYDSLAAHMLHGSVEVDPQAIESESFIESGKTFMYFGPFPALLRIIPNWIFPSMYGNWSRWSCLLAGFLTILAFVLLLRDRTIGSPGHIRSHLLLTMTAGMAFGSPVLFLMSCGYIYHEAILWALCWSMWGLWFWQRFTLIDPKLRYLIWLSICAAFSLLSRVTFGMPLLICLGLSLCQWIFIQTRQSNRTLGNALLNSCGVMLVAVSAVGAQLWYNYARFGSPFRFIDTIHHTSLNLAPISYQIRLAELGIFNFGRILNGLNNYLGFDSRFFLPRMSFVSLAEVHIDPNYYPIGYIEWTLPLTICSSWLILCGLIGLEHLLTNRRWVQLFYAGVFAVPPILVCVFYFMTQRYSAEFLPFLTFLSLFAVDRIQKADSKPKLRQFTMICIDALCVLSIIATSLSALSYNANYNWAAPKEYKQELTESFKKIDGWLGL